MIRVNRTIAGLISVGAIRGTPEAASASLVRYLAKAPWFPTALLPSDALTWTPIDEHHARATLTDASTTVSIDVEFGETGTIESIATMRYRDAKGVLTLTPWIGRFSTYRSIAGMMIPMAAEVGWTLPDGFSTAWRGQVSLATHEFEPAP